MRCRNCKQPLGLDLSEGMEFENVGNCSICEVDVCNNCVVEIKTPADYDPGVILLCSDCTSSSIQTKKAVA